MRSKKAKKLRRQAGVTTTFFNGMRGKDHKKIKHPSKDWENDPTQLLLNEVSWTYYKELKRRSKNYTAT